MWSFAQRAFSVEAKKQAFGYVQLLCHGPYEFRFPVTVLCLDLSSLAARHTGQQRRLESHYRCMSPGHTFVAGRSVFCAGSEEREHRHTQSKQTQRGIKEDDIYLQ